MQDIMQENRISDELRAYLLSWLKTIPNYERTSSRYDGLSVAFSNLGDLAPVSRKIAVIADKALFLEDLTPDLSRDVLIAVEQRTDDLVDPSEWHDYPFETFLQTSDLGALEEWFRQAGEMLTAGRITYVPSVFTVDHGPASAPTGSWVDRNERRQLIDTAHFHRAVPGGSLKVTDPNIVPLFNLRLPSIEGVTLGTLNGIITDYPEKLSRFRNYLLKKLLDIRSPLESDEFAREIMRVQVDLDDAVRDLNDRYESMKRVHAFQAVGGSIVPWALTVIGFFSDPTGLLKIVGPGGGIATLSIAVGNYLRERYDLGRNPVDFLLVIGKSAGA